MPFKHVVTAAILAASALSAQAASYAFSCVTRNAVGSCQDGEAKINMIVSDAGSNRVDFTFTNKSLQNSSITEIYFDDGTLLGIASVLDSGAGVTFSQIGSGNPSNLPGGESLSPAFKTTAGFLVDTGNGGPSKGVENLMDGGVQEFVTIRFNLINGKTFSDTLAALNGPLGDGNDLRVGLHAKSFTGGYSESFVNSVSSVPEPAGFALSLSALVLFGALKARRRQAAQPNPGF